MATQQRIENLKKFCDQWEQSVSSAENNRDDLIRWKSMGMRIFDPKTNEDQLPTLIEEADDAVQSYKKIHLNIQSLLGRAMSGEDV